jgi:sulfate transport system substrate-binding protein
MRRVFRASWLIALTVCAGSAWAAKPATELLNASYDVSRELFTQINPAFAAQWKNSTGQTIVIRQSHGGSSAQARAVAEGLQADVVTFNQVTDIEFLRKAGLVAGDWQARFPNQASPYYSLPVFLVRAGNPKSIKDWDDLARAGIKVIFPNPKTSSAPMPTRSTTMAVTRPRRGLLSVDCLRTSPCSTRVVEERRQRLWNARSGMC